MSRNEKDGRGKYSVSLKETLGLFHLEDIVDFQNIVKKQHTNISGTMKEGGLKVSPKQSLSFFIPLDAYIPLPEPYHASIVSVDNGNKCKRYSTVSLVSYELELKVGNWTESITLSAAIVTIADESYDFKTIKEINKLIYKYEEAIEELNDFISAYKMTPGRHNHNLQPVTLLDSPGNVTIALYDINDGNFIEKDTFLLHERFITDLWECRELSEIEIKDLSTIHTAMKQGWSMPIWLADKVNQAIDMRCKGRNSEAVVVIDHYAELTIRFILSELLRLGGLSAAEAKNTVRRNRKMETLMNDLAKELGYRVGTLKEEVRYGVWHQKCRKLRNKLSHEAEIMKVTSHKSFNAIDSTVLMVNGICGIVNARYPDAIQDTQWLMAMSGLTESMKAKKGR